MEEFSRTELLIKKEGIESLQNSTVAIFGVGGVGGFEKAGGNAENMLHDCGSGSTS